jgi:hypothetical protein
MRHERVTHYWLYTLYARIALTLLVAFFKEKHYLGKK